MTFTWPAIEHQIERKIVATAIDRDFFSIVYRSKWWLDRSRAHRAISGDDARETDERVVRFNNERCNVALAGSYSRGCREIDDSRPGIGNNVLPVFRLTRRFVNVSASRTGSRTIY